jgi:uncharacterized Zn-finger protein
LKRHVDSVHLKLSVHACTWENCTKTFPSIDNMRRHINLQHLKLRNFPCPNEKCDYKCSNTSDLKSHLKSCKHGRIIE